MLQRLAVYRVLRIAAVALPAIAAYRWLELHGRLGRPATPATWDRVHDRVAPGLHDLRAIKCGWCGEASRWRRRRGCRWWWSGARESRHDRMTCRSNRSRLEDALSAAALRRTFRKALTAATAGANPIATRAPNLSSVIIIVSSFPCQGVTATMVPSEARCRAR
jgi:hypothetical protein